MKMAVSTSSLSKMVDITNLMKAARAVQATALAGENIRVANKKKKRGSDFLQLAAANVTGSTFIRVQASLI